MYLWMSYFGFGGIFQENVRKFISNFHFLCCLSFGSWE